MVGLGLVYILHVFFNLIKKILNELEIGMSNRVTYDDTNDNHDDYDCGDLLELGGVHFEDMQSAGNRRPRCVLSWGSSMIIMIFMIDWMSLVIGPRCVLSWGLP